MKRRDFLKTGGAAIAGGALIGVSGSLATSCLSPTGRDRDLGSTDVLVVGGGPAGVCAAIAAARCGAKTVIVEQGNCLGGMATRGLVAPFMTCYDTTGDIRDTWQSMAGIGFDGQDRWAGFTGPGHWPDADMLVLGKVGWGRKMHWTELTPWEQSTHIRSEERRVGKECGSSCSWQWWREA